jgi:hypothetical protein
VQESVGDERGTKPSEGYSGDVTEGWMRENEWRCGDASLLRICGIMSESRDCHLDQICRANVFSKNEVKFQNMLKVKLGE